MLGLELGVAGGASGWVAGRAGFWSVLEIGLGVSGSSPQVLRHPTTSICDSGINNTRAIDLNTKKGIYTRYYKNLIIIVICTY